MSRQRRRSRQEGEVIDALKAGDEWALQYVLRTVGPKVDIYLANKYKLSLEDREEILADGLYRLWTTRSTYNPERLSLQSYFFLLTDSAAKDYLKKAWHQSRRREVSLDFEVESVSRNRDSADMCPQMKTLLALLDDLPQDEYEIVITWACTGGEGAWAKELSAELGIPASSIRVTRLRALRKLEREMRKRLGGE